MAISDNDLRYKARDQWDKEHPKPQWEEPETVPPMVIKHSNGRVWFETSGDQWANQGSLGDLHITFGAEAKSVTLRVDQLDLIISEAINCLNAVKDMNAAKDAFNERVKSWEAEKSAFVEQAVKDWRKEERAEKKAAKG